ncbi:mitochondrial import receptor subunit (Tom20) [Penicillium sp. IBT 35674x]|uniref:Mitochondrial import receptor subunit TOM20 n=1 Tax=Penicillium frequentans TaxID=3151616 RepID=A0AAD6GMB8_9EURO|nr:mitochondrial import receptor subunit (Tom20) [Penicillium pulvis]KAJ5557327.1 mitochondrial import receptor subunit (Tom20) [Penicillium glabrum]KAJ5560518.1 mitochondrial import receptor subunit (Tom20) [Penicillium glabrum]KAJ5813457.1 mitochondrial import receptor subunit (Tom20) [Penicillium pulvis]KAJ6003273.1 mitochondrial import receptor subunit (Tom20) [Penicillium sp. IBT 35674x]
MRTSVLVAASAGTIVAGLLAYAAYFDHKRQTDAEFRKSLKRNNKRLAKAVKEEVEAQGAQQREVIKQVVQRAKEEGFPTDLEEKESYFMNQVATGEGLCQDGSSQIEAALAFYKALKVYPQPKDLISIYDKTVPKEVLEILAEMVAMDAGLKLGSFTGEGAADNHGVE